MPMSAEQWEKYDRDKAIRCAIENRAVSIRQDAEALMQLAGRLSNDKPVFETLAKEALEQAATAVAKAREAVGDAR